MLYEIVARSRYFDQEIINRWNYVSSGTPASVLGSFALIAAFGAIPDAGVYPDAAPFFRFFNLASTSLVVESIEARAASDYAVTDFYERPFVTPYNGGQAGTPTSPTMAYGWRTNRVRLDISRGTKRLAGVSEDNITTGGNIGTTALELMVDIATFMSEVLTYDDEGSTISFSPCVVSKEEYTTPSGKRAYKYYPTLAEQMEHVAIGIDWQPYTTVRTQTSRQYGHGA